MKKNSIHITIPEPCHEKWDEMSPTDRGAFCRSCQKEVIDFSRMSDGAIVDYLSRHRDACGNFRQDQVARQITLYRPKGGYLRWQVYMLSLLPLMSFKSSYTGDTSCVKTPDKGALSFVLGRPAHVPDSGEHKQTQTIYGLVKDVTGAPVAGAVVQVMDSTARPLASTLTDAAGYYRLTLADHAGYQLYITRSGYHPSTQALGRTAGQQNDITLERESPMIKGKIKMEPVK